MTQHKNFISIIINYVLDSHKAAERGVLAGTAISLRSDGFTYLALSPTLFKTLYAIASEIFFGSN